MAGDHIWVITQLFPAHARVTSEHWPTGGPRSHFWNVLNSSTRNSTRDWILETGKVTMQHIRPHRKCNFWGKTPLNTIRFGVIDYHNYLKKIVNRNFKIDVIVVVWIFLLRPSILIFRKGVSLLEIFTLLNRRTRQIILYRATATLRRPHI